MVTQITTKFSIVKKYGKNNQVYKSPRIYISNKLAEDSAFPFFEGEEIILRIVENSLIVEKTKSEEFKKHDIYDGHDESKMGVIKSIWKSAKDRL